MKRIQKYIFLLLIMLQFQFVTYSQAADAPPAEIDPGSNPLDAPIDHYVWMVLIMGILLGIYSLRKSRKTAL